MVAAAVAILTVSFSAVAAAVPAAVAGPLVALGLVVDAIRTAGALMVVPWLLLAVYTAGWLRASRQPISPAGTVPMVAGGRGR